MSSPISPYLSEGGRWCLFICTTLSRRRPVLWPLLKPALCDNYVSTIFIIHLFSPFVSPSGENRNKKKL